MNSFIIVSKNTKKREDYITNFCKKKNISQFDQNSITTDKDSIGIAEIRNLQQSIFLKPFKSQEKVIILNDAEKLTIEAQHALLKILEEPPANTYIFLASSADSVFLPTVISRCKVVFLEVEKKEVARTDQVENDIEILRTGSITSRLVLAETLASKKESLAMWFEQTLSTLRNNMLNNPEDIALAHEIQILSEAVKVLQTTNVNVRLILEHYFLELL